MDGDFSKYDLDMTVKPDPTPGLCSNNVNENCCSCFKKHDSDSGCHKVKCYHQGKAIESSFLLVGLGWTEYCFSKNRHLLILDSILSLEPKTERMYK